MYSASLSNLPLDLGYNFMVDVVHGSDDFLGGSVRTENMKNDFVIISGYNHGFVSVCLSSNHYHQ